MKSSNDLLDPLEVNLLNEPDWNKNKRIQVAS